jgi:ABC-2 type transport system permease protein
MSWKKTLILSKREYLSRVKSKGYWLGTLVLPLLLGALVVIPGLIFSRTTSELDVVVVDTTGGELGREVRQRLEERRQDPERRIAAFDITLAEPEARAEAQRTELDRRLMAEEIDAWMWIDAAGLAQNRVEYRARNVSNTFSQEVLADELSRAVRERRLVDAGYDPDAISGLLERVGLSTVRVTAEGSREEAGEAGFLLAYGLFFLLYVVLMMWGQQVLQGVLEEKSSRVVEVIVSAATPFELMIGKLLGIGAAALTQFGLWLACIVALTAPGLIASMVAMPEGFGIPTISIVQALYVLVFFVLGFFVYSTMYAAVGAAFNTVQEAQQLSMVPTFAIISPLLFFLPVTNDSGGPMAIITSMVPIMSPILMPLRIAIEMPPAWQVWLSIAITAAFVWLMIGVCARIYRVGILMYGKKPTVQELWRWLRYA